MKHKYLQIFSLIYISFFWHYLVVAEYPDYENVYVNDWANLLDSSAEEQISQQLKFLKLESDVEITLVTIAQMSDYPNTKKSIEDFALDLFNQWGVGNAQSEDGVLVLVSRFDRKMRIATGKAYDDTKMNNVAKDIIDDYFIPHFKRNNYEKGITVGMQQVVFEFSPKTNASASLGFMSSAKRSISHTTSNAWHEVKKVNFLIYIFGTGGIVLLSFSRSLFVRLTSSGSNAKVYSAKAKYVVDKQPKRFKQAFPNNKKFDKKPYWAGLFLGLIAILFIVAFLGFEFFAVALLILLSSLAICYAIAEFTIRKRNKAKTCPRCSNLMSRLSEVKDDKYLLLPERVEESLKAIDYDVWLCGDCLRTKKLAYPYWQSSVVTCEQCEYKTLEIDINTIIMATTSREGLEEVIEDCKYCDFHNEYEQTIPEISESNDDYDSGGSSFGGGSSSGGGASGSW